MKLTPLPDSLLSDIVQLIDIASVNGFLRELHEMFEYYPFRTDKWTTTLERGAEIAKVAGHRQVWWHTRTERVYVLFGTKPEVKDQIRRLYNSIIQLQTVKSVMET